MQQIERMLVSNRARLFYTLKETFQQLHKAQFPSEVMVFPEFDDKSITFWRTAPKQHAIGACFLQNFWQREAMYHHCMSSTSLTPRTSWLSCDHTFKSVCNIGTVRQADSKWIQQYAGLFCVLNADGQILSRKMTKSLAFENIRDNLISLQRRLQRRGEHVKEIFVDTCCSLRSQLQDIFGPQLKVYWIYFMQCKKFPRKCLSGIPTIKTA